MTRPLQPDVLPGVKPRPESLLMLCFFEPSGVSTVPENVAWFQRLSNFPVTVINLFEHRHSDGSLGLHPAFNLDRFDGLVIHNSISYNVGNLRLLDRDLRTKLSEYRGVKVLMKQDENYRFRELAEYIGETHFDILMTCLPEEAIEAVYPSGTVGNVCFLRMLTGYVTPTLRSLKGDGNRKIDIGYRGSIQPLSFGRLAFEKRKIGHDVERLLCDAGLRLDISSRWEDRLGSGEWLSFLLDCKATLGVESGASVFGIREDLSRRLEEIERKLGPVRDDDAYAEAYLAELADLEGDVHYNQVSPRHFEAAAARTLQIMYPGEYSGIFKAGRHFLELERDCSNLDSILAVLNDDERRRAIVECAYEEIINNQEYWIETFVSRVDEQVSCSMNEKGRAAGLRYFSANHRKNVLLICAHDPSLDPRLEWISEFAPEGVNVIRVGVLQSNRVDSPVSVLEHGRLVLAEPRANFDPQNLQDWYAQAGSSRTAWAALSELRYCFNLLSLPDGQFHAQLGAPMDIERVAYFRSHLRHLLDTSATLIQQALAIRGISMVVATDLDTLPAALTIKGMFDVPVLYDARSHLPEVDVSSYGFERTYWERMEKRLLPYADHCQAVSTGLAEVMGQAYGIRFDVVPNCEPIFPQTPREVSRSAGNDRKVRFLFQGRLERRPGIDLLIKSWPKTIEQAVLVLRGTETDTTAEMIELARETGLLGNRIQFETADAGGEPVATATQGDIGLVPYTSFEANYSLCCPKSISQYMSAGLPILANDTRIAREIIEDCRAGVVLDFWKEDLLVKSVASLVGDIHGRMQMAENATRYFSDSFNWQRRSRPMYSKIADLTAALPDVTLRVFFQRIAGPLYIDEFPSDCTSNLAEAGPLYGTPTLNSADFWHESARSATTPKQEAIRESWMWRIMRSAWHALPSPIRRVLMPVARHARANARGS